jgi:hypothetical protein
MLRRDRHRQCRPVMRLRVLSMNYLLLSHAASWHRWLLALRSGWAAEVLALSQPAAGLPEPWRCTASRWAAAES